jgi:hypothetical protein
MIAVSQAHPKGGEVGNAGCGDSVRWTPVIKGRLKSHSWLDNTGWEEFLDKAQVGEIYNGKGVLIVVRLLETKEDFTELNSNNAEQ